MQIISKQGFIMQWEKKNIKPDNTILTSLIASEKINLLFFSSKDRLGKHTFLLKFIKYYVDHYGMHLCLHWILPKQEQGIRAGQEIMGELARHQLQSLIHIVRDASEEGILSYYLGCDFFLSFNTEQDTASLFHHAQFAHLPILAQKTLANLEMLGQNQLLLEEIEEYAAAIYVLTQKEDYKEYLIEEGFKNYCNRTLQAKMQEISQHSSPEKEETL